MYSHPLRPSLGASGLSRATAWPAANHGAIITAVPAKYLFNEPSAV